MLMNDPLVLLTSAHSSLGASLARYGYESTIAADSADALTILRATRGISVLVADVDRGGLLLAREARTIRSDLRVVYIATAPHRVAEKEKVHDAPILRSPVAAHQLAGVIAGLGRRVLDDPLAA
jgi:DNA-binding response OmpR family regulator